MIIQKQTNTHKHNQVIFKREYGNPLQCVKKANHVYDFAITNETLKQQARNIEWSNNQLL